MKSMSLMSIVCGCVAVPFFATGLLAKEPAAPAAKETVVATLSKDQIKEFSIYARTEMLRREEFAVISRMIVEKQKELKGFVDEMSKEFDMSYDKSYTFEKESKSLYLLSTNKVDKAGKPERTLLKKIKTDGEAKYLSRLMVARRLTEQQLFVLRQLKVEKNKEFGLVDSKLRQTFKLDSKGSYRLDQKTGQVFQVTVAPKADAAANPAAGAEKAKDTAKK